MKGSLSWQLELVTTYLTFWLDALVLLRVVETSDKLLPTQVVKKEKLSLFHGNWYTQLVHLLSQAIYLMHNDVIWPVLWSDLYLNLITFIFFILGNLWVYENLLPTCLYDERITQRRNGCFWLPHSWRDSNQCMIATSFLLVLNSKIFVLNVYILCGHHQRCHIV